MGTFSSVDPEPAQSFTYTLVAGTGADDNSSFAISGNTLQTGVVLDSKLKTSYTIRVRSTDQGSLSVEKAFTLTVTPNAKDDLNGDGRSDIVWRNTTRGTTDYGAMYLWMMDGTRRIGATYLDPISMAWRVQGIADFTGDGKSDILWREDGTGSLYLWVMDGSSTADGTGYLLGTPSGMPDFTWEIQ